MELVNMRSMIVAVVIVSGLIWNCQGTVTCYFCASTSATPSSSCETPTSSTATCNNGTQCAKAYATVSGVTTVARYCSTGLSTGCYSSTYDSISGTICSCTTSLCNTGSTTSSPKKLLLVVPLAFSALFLWK